MSLDFIKQYAPNISAEAEDHAYKTSIEYLKKYAGETKNQLHINKLLNHSNFDVKISSASNPNISDENLDKAISYKKDDLYLSMHVRKAAAKNTNAKSHHLDMALNDAFIDVREAAASNPNCSKQQFDKGLLDEMPFVRRSVARNINIDRENLSKALNDRDVLVKQFARSNPRYKEFFPNGHE